MSKQLGIATTSQKAWLSAGLPIVALVLIVAVGALSVFVNFAHRQNQEFRIDSRKLAQSALEGRGKALSDITLDFANWNDAYSAVSVRWDAKWVERNFYSNVTDGLIVFHSDGSVRHSWVAPDLRSEAERLTIGAVHAAQDIPGVTRLMRMQRSSNTVTRGVFAYGGRLAWIAVAPISPQDDRLRLAIPATRQVDYVASVQMLDSARLAELGESLNLNDLRFEQNDVAPDVGYVSLTLHSADGAVIGELRWRDERPGDRALAAQIAPVVVGLLLIGALTALLAYTLTRHQLSIAAHAQAAVEADQLKSDFISAMSNELTTPLNAIIGYAELIQEGSEDHQSAEVLHKDATRILTAAQRLRQLVENTLDQSRIDAGHLKFNNQRVEISELLNEVSEIVGPLARANGDTLDVSAEHNGLYFIGDHLRVRQCLLNLAGNAVKFTKNGGVRVHVRNALRNGARFLTFDVTDTGVGIDPSHATRLFQPFEQGPSVQREYGGAGLGLAISRKLARAMGGDIVFVSELGRGSCFSLHIPVSRADVPRQRVSA